MYFEKNIQLKTVKFKRYKHKQENWMTKGLLKSIRNKDLLHYKLKRETNQAKKEDLEKKYKSYRNRLNTLIRLAKKMHWKKYFSQVKTI